MAGGQNRVNVQVGFSIDKSGLSEMQSLFQQIANRAKEPGAQLDQGLKQAATTAGTLDQILEKTFNTNLGTLNVTKFNQELSKSGLTLKQVKADLSGVGNQGATAYNRLAQAVLGTNLQLKESSKLLDTMAISMANTVKWGITSSIFNNITQAISKAVTYAKQLDTSLNDIRIVTDKSADSMDRFAEKANTAAKQMGASTLDYTNAALIYYQQGLSDEEVAARAETTIKAANVTGQTGQEVSEQLTAVWNGYKVTAEETELYVDKLAAVAATTAADLEELSTGMSKVAAAANAMGVDFDDLNAQIATIVSVTRQAPESVGTALKTIYARLGDLKVDGVDEFGVKLGEVSSQMQTMGIQILDQNGDLRDMSSVIAEVAEKWGTWTRAQQQAAAVAMAGKRQYNNLVALFENWDMYSDALETSANAMGTLQHQQDIYMESTAAKLKTLKATWQDMYEGLIDNDEINAGIEGLTNLVQVFDNFIDSFGGGLKSITAFGTIVANIFNKQIANALNNTIQRQEIFKQNLALAQMNADTRAAGIAQLGANATPQDLAIEANTKVQLEYAQRIYDARVGLNQEQYNSLTNYQKEIGALEEESVLYENQIKLIQDRVNFTEKEVEELQKYGGIEDEIGGIYQQRIEKAQTLIEQTENLINIVNEEKFEDEEILDLKKQILDLSGNLTEKEKDELKILLEKINTEDDEVYYIDQIFELLNKIKQANKENLSTEEEKARVAGEVANLYQKQNQAKEKQNNFKQEADEMLRVANNAQTVTQRVTTVTSALGSMAMAWSSVNSLMQTWNDESASFGDKLTQTFMTLGFTLPMVISNFNKLNEVFGIVKLTEAGLAAQTQLMTAQNVERTLSELALNAALGEGVTEETLRNVAVALGIPLTDELALSVLGEMTAEELLNEVLSRQLILRRALLKEKIVGFIKSLISPIGLVVISLTALVATLAAVKAHYDKVRQAAIDSAKATIEENNSRLNEIDSNKDLIENYNDLINSYKEGKISKTELAKETEDLCDKYNIENAKLLILADNYDALTAAIQRARKAELDEAETLTRSNLTETERSAKATASNGVWTAASSTTDIVEINSLTGESITGDVSTSAGILEYYNKLIQARDELIDSGKNKSGLKKLEAEIADYQEYVDQILANSEKLGEITAEQGFYDKLNLFNKEDLDYESFVSTYENILESVKATLQDELGSGELTQEEYDKALKNAKKYLNSLIDSYDQASRLLSQRDFLEDLMPKLDASGQDYVNHLSEDERTLLLSGKVQIDGLETAEELQKAFEIAKNELSEEDLSIAVSLREKISSDKKLTKKQIEEAAGETSTLAQDYDVALSDFDNQSQLRQVDTLNQIVNDKIALNKKYIDNAKEAAQEEKDIENTRLANYKEEQQALEVKKKAYEESQKTGGSALPFTEEDQQALDNINNKILQSTDYIEELQNIVKNGLGFDELDNLIYDNLIAGIDGIITEAEVLRNLTDDIGESWTIAADKIENFGKNFPEILEDAQNYNFLQDGSLQLTEAGRIALEDTLNARKANLEAVNKEYQLELQKQADIQQATADYYTQQADLLEAYLNGQSSAKDTEAAMEEGLNKYKAELAKITGENDKELNETIQTNLGYTVDIAKMDTKQIFDYWCEVGKAAEAASLAYENKLFVPPAGNFGGGGAGTKTTSYQGSTRDISSGDYLKDFDDDQIQSMIDDYRKMAEEATNKAADYISKKVGAESSLKSFINSADKAISGEGNGKSSKSGGSGKDKKDKDDKKLEDEFDRYWEIKKAIDATDRSLKKLDKDQENLYGKELINSLKLENELLDQQAENYRNLAAAQQQEAAELQSVLAGYGVAFDASGAITNYAAATAAALQQYNDAIHQYNMGLIDESTLGVYEKNYEKFKKALERYDQLFYTEMKDTEEKLDEIRRKQLANNLKAWQVEIQLKLDTKDLERQWNDFITKVTKDFQKVYSDLRVDLKSMLNDARTYLGDEGTLSTIISAVHDVTAEIDKMRAGGSSDMFESISQAQEELKDLNQKLLDAGEALHDLWEQAWDNYLDGIDQVADQFDDLIDRFEKINDELAFQGELIELLYGEEAYGLMDKLFKGQEHNTEAQLRSLVQQRDMWKQLFDASGATMENQKKWNEDQRKYYEEWMEAQTDLNNLVLDYIKLLKEDYLNTVKDVLKQFETFVSGSSLAHLGDQWDRIADRADKYYDSVEGAYEVQKLANEMDESIANTTNLKTQQQLQALRDKEIKYLREKENLTEYDLQAAEARFQIALKQAALDDAQNNKTSMKLTRNEQGNWSYQYIADEDEVMNKRQELLDAYNQLYQLASDAYEANLEALMNLQQTYLDKAREIYESEVLTEEEKQEQLLELRTWYLEEYKLLAEENTLYRNDLQEGAAALLLEIYNQDQEAYTAMTEAERELLDSLIAAHVDGFLDLEDKLTTNYMNIGDKAREVMEDTRADWTSGAQTIADLWNGNNGFSVKVQVTEAYNAINNASIRYKELVDWCAAAVGRDFSEQGIAGAIMKAEQETDNLNQKTADLVNSSVQYLSQLRAYVDQIADAWRSVQQAIMDAIGLIQEYLKYVGEANSVAAGGGSAGGGATTGGVSGGGNSGGSGTKSGGGSAGGQSTYIVTTGDYGKGAELYRGTYDEVKRWTDNAGIGEIWKMPGFATGGYTGEWPGTDGRVAMLHQKELVLNESDTANFLKGINVIREMAGLNGSIESAIMKSVANMAISLGNLKAGSINNTSNKTESSNNTFNISAEFPNANNVDEIRQAILTLPNMASQMVNTNLR